MRRSLENSSNSAANMVATALVASMISDVSNAFWGGTESIEGVQEVTDYEKIFELIEPYSTASIISFYNKSADSKHVNSLMDNVKTRVDSLLADDPESDVDTTDLGWFRVSLDEFPNTDIPIPDYLYIANDSFFSLNLLGSFAADETDEQAETRIAERIFNYTLPGVTEISCDDI